MKQRSMKSKRLWLLSMMIMVIFIVMGGVFGCAPNESSTGESEDTTTATQGDFSFSMEADCGTCHEVEQASLDDTECPMSLHTSMSCMDCHSDVSGLTEVHDGVTYEDTVSKRLKKTEVSEELCFTCHDSYDSLTVLTQASTILTDKNSAVVNPHALPESEEHESVTCGSCHSMHSSDDVSETASNACLSCHHMGIYECNTCHE